MVKLEMGQDRRRPMAGTCYRPNGSRCLQQHASLTNTVDGMIYPLDVNKTFLNMTITARNEASGVYTCIVYCSNGSNVEEYTAEANLTVDIVNNETVRALRGLMQELKDQLKERKEKVIELSAKTSDLNASASETRKATSDLRHKDHELSGAISEMKSVDEDLRMAIGSIQDKNSFVCGFTASLSSDTVMEKRTKIVFDKVATNLGGGYDRHSGVFTVPTDGLYAFHVAMTAIMDSTYCCDGAVGLFVNKERINGLGVDVARDSIAIDSLYPQSSMSKVLSLEKGDKVSVRSLWYKAKWSWYSHFSGFLITG